MHEQSESEMRLILKIRHGIYIYCSSADYQSIHVASSSSSMWHTSERNIKEHEQHTCECLGYYTIKYPNLSNSNLQDLTIIGLYTVRG